MDIDQCLSGNIKLCTFVDDTTLYSLIKTPATMPDVTASLQKVLDKLMEWGRHWRIRFEPTKSQRMVVSSKNDVSHSGSVTFSGSVVQDVSELKLLGVTFDQGLSFRQHIRSNTKRACQRLGFLRKAARVLDKKGLLSVYKGFVRPILEYAPLVWKGASASNLAQLDKVQRKAMKIIGPGVLLQSLAVRRMVSALAYIYKLHCLTGPPQLVALLPNRLNPVDDPRTRQQLHRAASHKFQLSASLPRDAPDYLRRSFPFSAISTWNDLPQRLLEHRPEGKSLQTFKTRCYKYLLHTHWLWATDHY